MQSLAFLWFELHAARQSLRESFAEGQIPENAGSLNGPTGIGTRRSASARQTSRMQSADSKMRNSRKRLSPLVRTGVYLAIAAIVYQAKSPQLGSLPAAQAMPLTTVSVVHPEKSGAMTLQLPGQLSAYTDAPIYAQTSGYLKSWSFDIGAKVKANDILGEIDTPEVDQGLAQAKAQLETDEAALQLAAVTYRRYQLLFVQKVFDAQTRDTSADTYAEDQAKVAADQANIDRLNALEAFKLLRAPFDGIVTARDIDVGAYVPTVRAISFSG
jgi:multidrug efflux system membrane fusion protein